MKWITPSVPRDGDIRVTLRFAWLPTECSDGYTRWLSDIYPRQKWVVHYTPSGGTWGNWETIEYLGDPGRRPR